MRAILLASALVLVTQIGQTMAMPNNQQPHAYVCIGFRDHIVQRMEFDDHVDYEKNWNEADNCAC